MSCLHHVAFFWTTFEFDTHPFPSNPDLTPHTVKPGLMSMIPSLSPSPHPQNSFYFDGSVFDSECDSSIFPTTWRTRIYGLG